MKTSNLIDELSKNPGSKSAAPALIFARWLAFSAVYLALMICIFELRDDILTQLQKPLFMAEIISLLMLGILVGVASIILSYPDNYQKKYLVYLPVIPLTAFIAVLWLQANESIKLTENLDGEIGCFICICIFALGPGVYLFLQLAKNATTSPKFAGAMGILAAFCFGSLVIRLTEKVDSMEHIILVHYVPLFFIALIGVKLGSKLLKW